MNYYIERVWCGSSIYILHILLHLHSKEPEKSSSTSTTEDVILSGSPYVMMVELTDYRTVRNVTTSYDVYVITKQLHWLVLVRMTDSDLPFLTFEVTTVNFRDSIPTMRRMSQPTTSFSTTRLNGNISVVDSLCRCQPIKIRTKSMKK